MMQLGAEAVFVGSGIFKSEDPAAARRAVVEATTHFADPERVAARLRGPGRARCSRSRRASSTSRSCSPTAAGSRRRDVAAASASSPSRAASPRTRAMLREPRRRRARGARARPTSTGLDGLVLPGGESTTMTLGIEREGLAEPLRELVARRHAGARHLRRADHARPRPPRADGHRAPSATPSAARCAPSRPTWTSRTRRRAVRAVFIRAPWIAEHGPGRRDPRRGRRPPGRGRGATGVAFHPELATTTGCAGRRGALAPGSSARGPAMPCSRRTPILAPRAARRPTVR